MISDIELSELLAVKLCHDLSGPVGAVNNGIELLRDGDADFYDQAVDLADSSAKDAVSRILFYRQAYGMVPGESMANPSVIKELSTNLLASSKVELVCEESLFSPDNANFITGDISKVILNLILLVSKSLIYGGEISVGIKDGDKILVRGEGTTVKLDADSEVILSGEGVDKLPINVKNVQAYFISKILERAVKNTQVSNGDDYIEIIVS